MAEDNVVAFRHASHSLRASIIEDVTPAPQQLDLFSSNCGDTRAIVYLDLENLDQEILLNSFIRHAVRTIIDLRSRPVFPKPRFDHKYLLTYFYQSSMNYIELAMIDSISESEKSSRCNLDRLSHWMADAHQNGFTACIIDAGAIEGGYVASFRRRISRSPHHWLEVHPRSILS